MKSYSLILTGTVTAALSLSAVDWPQYRGVSHDGSTTEKIATKWPAGGPKPVWKAPLAGGFSSFAVSGSQAFTLVKRDVEGAGKEVCVAVDAATGKEQWATSLGTVAKYDGGGDSGTKDNDGGDGPRSTPTVDGGKVYTLSAQLVLHCLDAKTGNVLWKHEILSEFHGKNIQWQNAASPVVEGGLVIVAGGGPGESLIALSKVNGAVAWKTGTETITHSTPTVGTIHGVKQVIFFVKSGLVSVDFRNGKELWKQQYRFAVSTAIAPVICGDIVYCAAGYGVGSGAYKITKNGDAFTSAEIWRKTGNQPVANHWSTPVYKEGHLYGMFQFKEYGSGPLKCVEVATGEVKWEKGGYGPGNVILAGNTVLALADNGELAAVEATPTGYKELSRAKVIEGKCWSTPVVANGRAYVRSTKEGVCVDIAAKSAGK